MICHENEQGNVIVSTSVYVDIAGTVASNCFGVKGMAARSVKDGLYHLLRVESMSKGVRVVFHEDNSITIELHIIVDNGVMVEQALYVDEHAHADEEVGDEECIAYKLDAIH